MLCFLDITLTNQGTCSIISANLPYRFLTEIVSSWNLYFYDDTIAFYSWGPVAPGQLSLYSLIYYSFFYF